MRRIPFEKVLNARDLGGYPISLTLRTQYERFIRCDAPVEMSQGELDWLRERSICTAIDLRTETERRERPCIFASASGFEYHACEFFLGEHPKGEEDMPDMYFLIADEKNAIRQAVQIIAGAPGGVLFHCSAGKDRTGVLSALLLSLVGVRRVDILADYQVSFTYLRELIERYYVELLHVPLFLCRSNVEYMEGFLDRLEAKYGSVIEYIRALGLSEDEIQAIRNKLLQP